MKTTKINTALATAALTITLLAPTAQALQPGDKYVALGDSYASTGTVTQPVPGSTPACVKVKRPGFSSASFTALC